MSKIEVESQAQSQLGRSGYAELKQITCHYDESNGMLTLQGQVSSYYTKQVAQEAVRGVAQVERVDNRIAVFFR